jgi:hypothetical protein
VKAAHATKEDGEAPRDCLTGDEASGRPAMARQRNFLEAAQTKVERDVGLRRGKERTRFLAAAFKGRRWERERRSVRCGHQWPYSHRRLKVSGTALRVP